jgi:serine phosphatase RsbU (regulator of sigma subunit)/PAS domain-containing protein
VTARRAGTVLLGLLIAGTLAAIDTSEPPHSIVIGTVVLAPFIVSTIAGPRETAFVGGVAFLLAVVSGFWNENFETAAYYLRATVVLVGAAISVLAASARERTTRDQGRFALLAELADVADGRLTLDETADRVCELIVPGFADLCVIDVVHQDGLRRLAVRFAGPGMADQEAALRARDPTLPGQPGSGETVETGTPELLEVVSDDVLRAAAHDDADLALLRSIRYRSMIIVPLSARGRTLGALSLAVTERSGRRYVSEERRFVEVLAGRVALALDNAGLFIELQTMEAQLTAVLGSLTEAVTVRGARGGLIYANQAAADLLGFESPQALLATPAREIASRYASYREDGTPLALTDVPGARLLAGEDPGPLVLRVVHRETGEEAWRLIKSSAVRDSAGAITLVVSVIADITASKRAELVQRLLAEAGEVLAGSDETLQRVAELCVPELADLCAISVPDDHGRLQTAAVAHADPEQAAELQRIGERHPVSLDEPGGSARVFRDGTPQLVNAVSDEMIAAASRDEAQLAAVRSIGMRAALLVPMRAVERTIGVLNLVNAESGRTFREEDVTLAMELARRAATALENQRLYSERTSIARILQASLLPEELPELPGWRAASLYRPAGDENWVGGDFYEAFPVARDWMLVVGDVTGRGAPAAALTALMRHTLRTAATLTGSAVEALAKLNRDLTARPDVSLCTAVCLVLRELGDGAEADVICAGHPLPVLVRDGVAEYVGRFGPMLGAFDDEHWAPHTLAVRPRDVLVLYSDGVLDAVGAEDRFGPERLLEALNGATGAADAVARIEAALGRFEIGAQADDTAILAVERIGARAPIGPEPGRPGEPAGR